MPDAWERWPGEEALARALRESRHLSRHWDREAPTLVSRAPGRLDVMGGIADYSGSLVLQLPIREATFVAAQPQERAHLTLLTPREERGVLSISLEDLIRGGEPVGYGEARAYFRRDPARSWAAYVAGAVLVLMRERGAAFPHGARLFIDSSVPEGRGVASSAALEVAAMMALDGTYRIGLSPREVALLCQKVENLVVGAPCGVMDQMTSVFGEENRLLALLCQPAELRGFLTIPQELALWGMDSGIAHAVSGADYGSVRTGAFMGYRILHDLAGTDWGGYLANLTPSELEQKYLARLPETMSGSDFLERYQYIPDEATTVDPSSTYRVRQPAAHPVREHFRIQAFARLLGQDPIESAPVLGELMYQSHASYSACGLGSQGTDRLVELAREAGPSRGIYGAKITGGGSGGTVAILSRRDAEEAVVEIARRYGEESRHRPLLFRGSSSGAARFGCRSMAV